MNFLSIEKGRINNNLVIVKHDLLKIINKLI